MQDFTINVTNFKSIVESPKLEIKAITLFFGQNSSGKTSIIQFLLMLKQTFSQKNVKSLILNGEDVKLNTFDDIIHNHDKNGVLGFRISIEGSICEYELAMIDEYPQLVKIKITFNSTRFELNENKVVLMVNNEYMGSFDTKNFDLSNVFFFYPTSEFYAELNSMIYNKHQIDKNNQEINLIEESRETIPDGIILSRLNTLSQSTDHLSKELKNLKDRYYLESKFHDFEKIIIAFKELEEFYKILINQLNRINHIGPLREEPQYYYSYDENAISVGNRGQNFISILIKVLKDKWKSQKFLSLVNNMNLTTNIDYLKFEEIYSILFTPTNINVKSKLKHLGFGVSQIMPILIERVYNEKSLLIVEQPELHLHPKLQGEIIDFFVDTITADNQILLETHSENILLRLQRRIAEGKISSEKVKIYYFAIENQNTRIQEVKLNVDGTLQEWPSEFFNEDLTESQKMAEALMKRKNIP